MSTTSTSTITFPYKRSLGPVLGAFMTALTEQRVIGIRDGDRVMCPPLEWSPTTGAELAHDFVDVGPAGTVESWGWVTQPTEQHPLDHPFAFASIRLDGADTALVHAVDVPNANAMSIGMRVAPRWRAERMGHITDIEAFVPGEAAVGGGGDSAAEPVTMMDYNASITYTTPVPDSILRANASIAEGKFLGVKCPACGRTYTGGRGYCPVDAIQLTEEHEVELPQRGVLTNFTIVTPIQYPGQTETDPFARVHILLDDSDVVLNFQELIEVPNDDIRIGMRLEAIWASAAEREDNDGSDSRRIQGLVGWMPTGEPDETDPDLVNRIC
ncbi:MAG TPA: OB-fold domain-containing protein [Acidimicrobiia bacterium]|nr:OB-fold domain-containing protein [Acidimicrobiia bacterium]